VIDAFTENVDIVPTLAEVMGADIPAQCDGRSLIPWLTGDTPAWRDAAHWEFDWRALLQGVLGEAVPDESLRTAHVAVTRTDTAAYVQCGDGSWLAFDLAQDPTWRQALHDPTAVLALAQRQLLWRSHHTERTLANLVLERGGVGRWPAGVPWRN
jgi:arylsulfatase A-like enzyme